MRPFFGMLLMLSLCLLGATQGGAAYKCGVFDGSFGCRQVPGNTDHGKNANPTLPAAQEQPENPAALPGASPPAGTWNQNVTQEPPRPGEHSCPPGYRVLAQPGPYGFCEPPSAAAPAAPQACPKNSELLGGTCVHYTATCKALAADAPPQVCPSIEEKLSCKMRPDGLKDCCCVTYDKM